MHSSRSRAPDPFRWLWYAVGGSLPAAYHEWVLFDLTCRTWVVRHFSRVLVQLSPWWLALFVPGPLTLRFSLVALGYSLGLNRRIREETPVSARAESAAFYASFYPPR